MGPAATTQPPLFGLAPQFVEFIQQRKWLEALTITCVSGVSFAILMKLSLVLLFGNGIAVCWPMVGLTAGVMLRVPRRYWPWMLAGVATGHIYLERVFPPGEMVVDTVCDVMEVSIAAFALPPLGELSDWIREPNLMARFIALPVLIGPLLTSIPVGWVFATELHRPFLKSAAIWFFADALGIMLWLPLAIVILSRETYLLLQPRFLPRTVGLIGSLVLICTGVFFYQPFPVTFLIMPILLLVALKLGFSGSAISVNVLSLVTAVATLHGRGPFGRIPEDYRVIALQVFLGVCMLMCFPISIVMLERAAFERELREAYERMERLATNDALTGLANRRQFDTALEEEWRRAVRGGQRVGLLMIDVDCFKRYNDCYGHVAGDECLRKIAESIGCGAMRTGDLVGRYGGEEFFVLMPHTNLEGLLRVAERIRHGVEGLALEHRENPHKVVTISIGCCSKVPVLDEKPESLVEAADQALYGAKQNGRNRVEAYSSAEEESRPIALVGRA